MDDLTADDPRRIGSYLLSGRLGAGGMGEVFLGRSPGGRAVAVKVVHLMYANNAEFRRRFRQEVELCRMVGGGYTANVIDADPDAPRPWMATAYVPGPPLNQVLAEYGALPIDTVRLLGAGLAEALVKIHAAGIIHRDLKPSNILLVDDGPRVIDFGIARAIDASGITTRPGTPGFMAPEVLTRQPLTGACDVFALGVVLAWARGIHPFGDGPHEAIDYRVVHEQPDLQGLNASIRGLVAECLAKDPRERPEPEQILERLAAQGQGTSWLPEPVYDMIVAAARPRGSSVPDAGPPDHARLLAEAEQTARALPDHYERAAALLHVATAACRIDPVRVSRLLDDSWYPGKHAPEAGGQRRKQLVEYLIESSAAEVGAVIAAAEPVLADQMQADLAEYGRLRRLRHMGAEAELAGTLMTIAEAAAAHPDRADRIARILTDPSLQAKAVARVAMAVARTDPDRASLMARTIISRIEQPARPVTGQGTEGRAIRTWRRQKARPAVAAERAYPDDNTARYWAVRALAEVAAQMGRAGPGWAGKSLTDIEHFASTVTLTGDPPAPPGQAPRQASGRAGIDLAAAARYLTEAGELAERIAESGVTAAGSAAADLRAGARCAVKTAAARFDPVRAAALLAEAEQAARAIGAERFRLAALAQVALAAADTDPARAEQLAGSLVRLPHGLGELALITGIDDVARAERIAATVPDAFLRALVEAILAVEVDPGGAGPLLDEAVREAAGHSARLAEVAAVIGRTDPARAEQVARALTSGQEIMYLESAENQYEPSAGYMRSAEYWKAWALADLAVVFFDSNSGTILPRTVTLLKSARELYKNRFQSGSEPV